MITGVRPEWIRIPDAIRFSGLSRSMIYELIGKGLVKSYCLRQRGKVRGTRLISFDSLSEFLATAAENDGLIER